MKIGFPALGDHLDRSSEDIRLNNEAPFFPRLPSEVNLATLNGAGTSFSSQSTSYDVSSYRLPYCDDENGVKPLYFSFSILLCYGTEIRGIIYIGVQTFKPFKPFKTI